jgi:hypothetical protein
MSSQQQRINPITEHPYTWRDHASCEGIPTDAFYPDDDDPDLDPIAMPYRDRVKALRPLCQGCAVFEECRLASIAELGGMWAGVTERPRLSMRLKHYREWDITELLEASQKALALMDAGALWHEALEAVGIADTPYLHDWSEGTPKRAGRKPKQQTEEVAA